MPERGDEHAGEAMFSTEATGLPEAVGSEVVDLTEGEAFDLRIAPVAKRLGETTVRMLAYNGSIPGPTLRVPEGSELVVNVANHTDLEATVHWHGLRLDNRYDGTHETQAPIQVGDTFSYRIAFPDPGVYWYHPHIREDYGQEMGLYGNILVVPADPGYWGPVHREVLLTLDDVLVEDGRIAPFRRSGSTHTAMGRFGNVMLVGGQTDLELDARRGEVVRFYLTNTANTRVFNVGIAGARMKLVGGDSGRYEHEELGRAGAARALGAGRGGRALRPAGRAARSSTTPPTGPTGWRRSRLARSRRRHRSRRRSRSCARDRELAGAARAAGIRARRRAGQDARLRGRDGHGRAGGRGRLRLPDAPRGREPGAGPLPGVRHEAAGHRGAGRRRTPARCTPRSSTLSPAAARSAA